MARKAKRATLPKEAKEFLEEVIQIDRVTRVVKGGRRLRFRATVVIGDRNGRVGIGIGKANEVTAAISKAIAKAKKTILQVPIINDTIPHQIKHKSKAAYVLLMPAGPGTGIIAGGAVRKVVDLAGIKNILSKSIGSSNKLSAARATYEALSMLRENPYIKRIKKEEPVAAPKMEAPVEAAAAVKPDAKPDAKPVQKPTPKQEPKKVEQNTEPKEKAE